MVGLFPAFADVEDLDGALTYTVTGNTTPGSVTAVDDRVHLLQKSANQEIDLGGENLFRVLAGPLASAAEAERICERLREAQPDAFCKVRAN